MALHALYAARLAIELDQELAGARLSDAFSTDKSTLFFHFRKPDGVPFYLQLAYAFSGSFIRFPDQIPEEHRNRQAQFKELHDLELIQVHAHLGNRSFHLEFPGAGLGIQAFGPNGNVFSFASGVVRSFRKELQSAAERMAETLPALLSGKWPETREGLIHSSFFKGTLTESWEEFQRQHPDGRVKEWVDLVMHEPVMLCRRNNSYSLTDVGYSDPIAIYDRLIPALHDWSQLELASRSFTAKKSALMSNLDKELKSVSKKLRALEAEHSEPDSMQDYRHLADLIMSNLSTIREGSEKARVPDYRSGREVLISLDPKLTPTANAEKYYRKAKRQHLQVANRQQSLDALRNQLDDLVQRRNQIHEAENIRELRPWLNEKTKRQQVATRLPYHEFTCLGYQILVGRQAKDNDELSLKIARKEDLWLHARDVSGSHVVIRKKSGEKIPDAVLETAAGLALWFSKRRSEAYAPVIYTQRKYIRKRKGDPAGAVVVEREKVLMASPLDPDQTGNLR